MGGNTFEKCERLTLAELERIVKIVLSAVQVVDGVRVEMPPELSGKTSFGDVDLHYTITKSADGKKRPRPEVNDELVKVLCEALECTQPPVRKPDFLTFLTKDSYQVDLVFFPEENFELSLATRANGDMAWLLNMSFLRVGLKLNEEGLALRREAFEPCLLNDFGLSMDRNEIRLFLGIAKEALDGRTSLTETKVFQIITSCKFFCAEPFIEYANKDTSELRKRKKSRPMYANFTSWLIKENQHQVCNKTKPNKAETLDMALEFFGKKAEFNLAVQETNLHLSELEHKTKLKKLVNGKLVQELFPGISGPEIGALMSQVADCSGTSWKTRFQFLSTKPQKDLEQFLIECKQKQGHCE